MSLLILPGHPDFHMKEDGRLAIGGGLTDVRSFAFNSAETYTISSGAITIRQGHVRVDTEGAAANDDLDTINGGESGEIIYLLSANAARNVRLRNGVGNIFLKHQVDRSEISFASPSGAGAATRYSGGGYYDWNVNQADLNQGALTVTHGSANVSYAAHLGVVGEGNGVKASGDLVLTVTGPSIDDEGNENGADSEVVVSDATTAGFGASAYFETTKKWLSTATITLSSSGGGNFNCSFNYGWSKYEDFANQDFTVTGLQIVGEAGDNETNFEMILFHHESTGWTYNNAGAFVPGGTTLAVFTTDHSNGNNLANGEPFAWKRVDLNTDVSGNNGEGVVFRIDTSAAKAVESMTGVVWVHTAPRFSYLATTTQHLVFMKHGGNWLEL